MTQPYATKRLYLASGSPRRQELMQQLNLDFKVVSAPIDETLQAGESPKQYVTRMAKEKALAGADRLLDANAWVVGGDTSVVFADHVLGKPENDNHAIEMLKMLSGQSHEVFSSICITHNGQVFSALNQTEVCFKSLSNDEIANYVAIGEPQGKAGAYAIQGQAAVFIKSIKGSFSGVMGLPLYELNMLLERSEYR